MVHSGTALLDPYILLEHAGVQAGMRVADFGCGRTGHVAFPTAHLVGERGMVYAVDIVQEYLENIRSRSRSERYGNVQAIWADIEKANGVPIPSRTLDTVLFVSVIWMLRDAATALSEAARVLKPGGTLVIVEWLKPLGTLGPAADALIRPSSLGKLAAVAGFTTIDNMKIGEYHYCALFRNR